MSAIVIKLSAEKPGSSYLRIVINGRVYKESFRDIAEIRRHFLRHPRHLEGAELPQSELETRNERVLGNDRTHKVIAVLNWDGEPLFYVIGGPGSHMWEGVFDDPKEARDFATQKAIQYDLG